jgi:hypothetical protein
MHRAESRSVSSQIVGSLNLTRALAAALPAAARLIAEARPFALHWYFDDVVIYSRRVKDVRIDAGGLFRNLHQWRIEP